MERVVNRKISGKKIVVVFILILILIIGFFSFAFHGMEIEDHYGDLQDFYFKSKSGDLIIFGDYEKVGIVDKTWTKIRIINPKRDTVDLYHWFYDDRYPEAIITLYKAKKEFSLEKLDRKKLKHRIENKEFKKIFSTFKTEDVN